MAEKNTEKNTQGMQLSLTVVAVVALVAIISLVALVMNAGSIRQFSTGGQMVQAQQTQSTTPTKNTAGQGAGMGIQQKDGWGCVERDMETGACLDSSTTAASGSGSNACSAAGGTCAFLKGTGPCTCQSTDSTFTDLGTKTCKKSGLFGQTCSAS